MDDGLTASMRRELLGLVDDQVMGLLARHLPLCLIMDLVMPAGPHSRELLETERALAGPV